MAPCVAGARHPAPHPRAGSVCGAQTIGGSTSVPCLPTAQAMGSLACDEGATAAPTSGSSKRDTLEPSLRARFKHMQKIGEGTYGVVPQWSKSGNPHVASGRAPSGASWWPWLCSLGRRALSLWSPNWGGRRGACLCRLWADVPPPVLLAASPGCARIYAHHTRSTGRRTRAAQTVRRWR